MGLDWKMFLSQLINFGIVFFILKKFAFLPIQKMLLKRKEKIDKGLEDADKAASEMEMAQLKYDEKVDKARLEANKIIAEGEKQRKEIVAQAQKEAKLEADKIVKQGEQKNQQERKEMIEEVKKQAVDLSLLATGKILGRKLSDKENRKFVEEIIESKH